MWESDEGATTSFWQATADQPDSTIPLRGDISTEVCIVGGGIAGLTTAYRLAKAGRRVVVVDDGPIGGGETARTTAHLSCAIDDRIYRIVDWHGEEKAKLAVESHAAAIDEVERIVAAESIACDFRRVDGYLFEAEDGEDDLEKELEAARNAGLTEVGFVDGPPFADSYGGRCLRFPNQGQFHVLKYLRSLIIAIQRAGGSLFPDTRVTEWEGGDRPAVVTSNGRITAEKLVLATNYPLQSKMFAQLPAYRTYAVGIPLPANTMQPSLCWDTADPYIYVRTQEDGNSQLLIVGGEDHRTGQADDAEERFQRLFDWARKRFSTANELKYRWSGQCMETHDGLAFIGQYSSGEPNVFLITGDSGMGMTHGTLGGMLVSDLIEGRENPWAEVYDPSRIATQSITEAVPEIVSSTVPYADWIKPAEISSEDELKPGEGAVTRSGLSKVAVYRDDSGQIIKRSAVCTHMGCIVRFNSTEKTWDCPCHGSRFGVDGEVINAPAISPLASVDQEN